MYRVVVAVQSLGGSATYKIQSPQDHGFHNNIIGGGSYEGNMHDDISVTISPHVGEPSRSVGYGYLQEYSSQGLYTLLSSITVALPKEVENVEEYM